MQFHVPVGLAAVALLALNVRAQEETLACYEFSNHDLTSSDNNPDVNASDLHVPDHPSFRHGDLRIVEGGYEFSVDPANLTDRLSLTRLFIEYGHVSGGVDRLTITADDEPGPTGDNFQTVLLHTSHLSRDIHLDLSHVPFLQNTSGPITFRLHYTDSTGLLGHILNPFSLNLEVDSIKLHGTRGPRTPTGNNPCVGPQLFFDDKWSDGNYEISGHEDAWFFPHWSNNFDVACIGNPDPAHSNHLPSIWATECSVGCRRLEFIIKGRSEGHDDDSIGFVIGYRTGDETNHGADYLAVIWNRAEQHAQLPNHCEAVTKPVGLSLVRVFGVPDPAEFFGQTNLPCTPMSSGVEVLATGINLGSHGWTPDFENNISFELTPTNLSVSVNGMVEIDRDADYLPYLRGQFGYFAQSQFMDAWGLVTTPLDPVQASWNNYGRGTMGCNGVPELTMTAPPVLNSNPEILVGNPSSADIPCALFWGLRPDSFYFPLIGGNILIGTPFASVDSIVAPPGGFLFVCNTPDDSCGAGQEIYAQAVCIDSCNPSGFALSRGLRLVLGDLE